MKNILALIFVISFILSCTNDKPKTVYYKIGNSKEVLTKTEFEEEKENVLKEVAQILENPTINPMLKDSIISHDSIILTYRLIINGHQEKSKISSFEGKKLPSMILTTIDNKKIDLSKIQKPTLINFWFVTCSGCIKEMPALNQMKEKYKNQVDFISVCPDNLEKVNAFLKKHTFTFSHLINAKDFVAELNIRAFPKNIFIDRNGIVKRVINTVPYKMKEGKLDESSLGELESYIDQILEN